MLDLFSSELRRKTFHLTGALIPIVYYFLDRETALIGLSIINAILLLVEWLRLNGKIEFSKALLRPHETKQVAAYIYFQMAALISILVFDKTTAIAALLMLAIGDTVSGLAGSIISGGDVRNNDTKKIVTKPLPIMAAMFIVCLMTGLVLLSLPLAKDMAYLSFPVYVAGAAGATLGDAIPLRIHGKPVDDNLMIPLLSGVFMSVVRAI